MTNVFISYRRDDAGGHAGRLYDHLDTRLDGEIFRDVDAIAPGADFVTEIEHAIEVSDALVVIIGRRWLDPGSSGTSRLHEPDDFVRREIAAALSRDVPVIPVLVDGASMPGAGSLPDDITALARRNAIALDDTRWSDDVERLIATIRPGRDTPVACPACGKDNPAGFAFCGFCSAALAPDVADEARKVVSVMQCRLVGGPELDPEAARRRSEPVIERLRVEIERFGGVIQATIGSGVAAVFGAPLAHEDDAERAIRAALRIVDLIDDDPDADVQVAVAIETGASIVTVRGEDERLETSVEGEVVDRTLASVASVPRSQVVVGDATHRLTEAIFIWQTVDPMPSSEPHGGAVRWRVVEPIARLGSETDRDDATGFVGRADELGVLRRTYERVVRDRIPHLVMVTGDPGVGKSRLLREFAGHLDDLTESITWRQGRCPPYGDGITFWALSEIVKAHSGIYETDTAGSVRRKIEAVVDATVDVAHDRVWVGACLGALAGAGGDEPGATADPEQLFAACRRFFEGVSDSGPLVVVFEDLHWADPALLAFVEHLAEEAVDAPIMLLGTARPALLDAHPGFTPDLRSTTWLPVPALSDGETARLIGEILGTSALPADVQAALLSRAAGNPLFAEQFTSLLLERNVLRRRGRGYTLADDADVPIPDNVSAIIGARIDALPLGCRRLLHDAAVVGKVFWKSALAQLSSRSNDDVADDLRELARRELIRRSRRSSVQGDEEYSFWHALTRDTAYEQVPRSELGVKHLAAADWIEGLTGERKADHADLLAHHLTEAYRSLGEPRDLAGRLRESLVEASDHLRRVDTIAAINRLERALALPTNDERARIRIQIELGVCLGNAARHDEASTLLGDVLTSTRDAPDLTLERARAAVSLARFRLFAGDAGRSRELLESAATLLQALAASEEVASLWADAAMVRNHDGDSATALAWSEIAMSLLPSDPDPLTRARILEVRGGARTDMGDEGGNEDSRAAVEVLARAGATADQGRSLSELGFSLLASEGPAGAIDVLEEGLGICVRTGVVSAEGNLRENLGEALFDAGRWDEALDQIAWQFRVAEQLGFDRVRLVAEVDMLAIDLARGNEVSLASPADVLERAARFQGPAVANVVDRIAGALLSMGKPEDARAALADTIDRFSAAPLAVRTLHLPTCLRLCRELDEPHLAEGFVRGLVPPSAPRMRAAVITAGATASEISQAFDDARDGYATAIPSWDAGGCVVEAAHARAGLGRALRALGRIEDATTPLMQARTRFAELGAARWVADVDRWLEGDTALTS